MSRLYTYKITSDYLRVEATSVSLYSRDVSGFTGHEHLYAFNLINMNGRNGVNPEWPCYFGNPMVSRMLSPDNYIQAPDFSQSFNRYSYAWNNPLVFTDPDGEIIISILIGAAIFGVGNLAVQAANGEINNFWDGAKAFGAGALAGAALGTGVGFGVGVPILGTAIKTAGWIYAGSTVVSGLSGLVQGIATGNWSALANSGKIFAGDFYLDSDRNLFGQAWQGISRFSWELPQSTIGHGFSQLRNTFGAIDRVDYFGGATFATSVNPNSSTIWGVSLGNHINIHRTDNEFDIFNDPLLMHEYGHTFDSQIFGLSYLLAVGIPSASGADWTEYRANRHAERYFRKRYDVDWANYLTRYPLRRP